MIVYAFFRDHCSFGSKVIEMKSNIHFRQIHGEKSKKTKATPIVGIVHTRRLKPTYHCNSLAPSAETKASTKKQPI